LSPPKHAGEPQNLAAGTLVRTTTTLQLYSAKACERLKPGEGLYVMVSSDSDPNLLSTFVDRAAFRTRLVHQQSIFIELLVTYELIACQQAVTDVHWRHDATAHGIGRRSSLLPKGFARFSSIGRRRRSVARQSRPALKALVDFSALLLCALWRARTLRPQCYSGSPIFMVDLVFTNLFVPCSVRPRT
jgi:hypothetical protein